MENIGVKDREYKEFREYREFSDAPITKFIKLSNFPKLSK